MAAWVQSPLTSTGPSSATYLRSWQEQGRKFFRGVVSAAVEPAKRRMHQVCTWSWQGQGFRSAVESKEWYLAVFAFARVWEYSIVADS